MELLLVGLLGLLMGIVTSISGGAGVFAVPTMLAFGIPPINVLALNRASDVGVVLGALKKYSHSKNIYWKLAIIAAIPLGIGSLLGSIFVINIPKQALNYVILLGVIVGIFFLLKPIKSKKDSQKSSLNILGFVLLLLVGFWSGSLAMGGGNIRRTCIC
ncbi:MAG: TSUP family transporter [Patescibacteria group bacterium]|jgi:hypothetical protein